MAIRTRAATRVKSYQETHPWLLVRLTIKGKWTVVLYLMPSKYQVWRSVGSEEIGNTGDRIRVSYDASGKIALLIENKVLTTRFERKVRIDPASETLKKVSFDIEPPSFGIQETESMPIEVVAEYHLMPYSQLPESIKASIHTPGVF